MNFPSEGHRPNQLSESICVPPVAPDQVEILCDGDFRSGSTPNLALSPQTSDYQSSSDRTLPAASPRNKCRKKPREREGKGTVLPAATSSPCFCCSLRFLFISLLVVCLTVNTSLLLSVNVPLWNHCIGRMADIHHDYVRRYVSSTIRDFVNLADVMVSNIGLYVQNSYQRGVYDLENEDFVGGEFLPFLMALEQSVIVGPHSEYAISYWICESGVGYGYCGQLEKLDGDILFTTSGELPSVMLWPYTGDPEPDGPAWEFQPPASRLAVLDQGPYSLWDAEWFDESMTETSYANDTIQWRETISKRTRIFMMTASRRVYGDCVNGSCSTLLGVANVWFDVDAVARFLQDQVPPDEGVVFLMSSDGRLFGSNTEHSDTFVREDPENWLSKEVPVYGPDSPNPIIRTASRHVLAAIESGSEYPKEETISGKNHGRIILGASSFDSAFPALVVVTAMSHRRIYFAMEFGVSLSAGMAFLLLLVTLLISVILLCCIIAPINRLVREMAKVEKMDLNDVSIGSSILSEVSSLQRSFSFTVRKLVEFRAFLPVHLLQRIRHSPLRLRRLAQTRVIPYEILLACSTLLRKIALFPR